MAKVREALNEYNKISNDSLYRAKAILDKAYEDIKKDQSNLLNIIKQEGGDNWVYQDEYVDHKIIAAVSMHKEDFTKMLDIEGFEGCKLYLLNTSFRVLVCVRYVC